MNNQAKLRTNYLYLNYRPNKNKPDQSSCSLILIKLVDCTYNTIHLTIEPLFLQPEDWDEQEYISDPEDKKPDGYDDIPKEIPDTDAKKVSTFYLDF